jgi:hypothetical protein
LDRLRRPHTLTFTHGEPYSFMLGGSLPQPAIFVGFAAIDRTGRLLGYKRLGCLVDSGADCTFLPTNLLPVLHLSADNLPKKLAGGPFGGEKRELPAADLIAHVLAKGKGIELMALFSDDIPMPLLGRLGAFDSLNIAFVRNMEVRFAAV